MDENEQDASRQEWVHHSHGASMEPPLQVRLKTADDGVVAVDITSKFRAAIQSLGAGNMVKDAHFTLFDAVSALEIMDPKMDSGCLEPGASLEADYDVARALRPGEVLGIMDQMLCLEMAWHLGYPLSQTLLTNVYVEAMMVPQPAAMRDAHFLRHAPARTDPLHAILRAYCLGCLKTCWHVNEHIKSEHYYEEEDFVTNTHRRCLLVNIDHDEIMDALREARKLTRALPTTSDHFSVELARALDCRLELRTALLRAIELGGLRYNPESLKLPWKQMRGAWTNVVQTHQLGTPVPEAFSIRIQQKLASTVPPRPIVGLGFDDASAHLKRMVEDGIEVLDVLKFSDSQSLLNFVLTFQAKKPQPLVFVRTMLQSLLFKNMVVLGSLSVRQLMDDDLSIVVLPDSPLLDRANDAIEATHHPRFLMASQMELFRQRAAHCYLDVFRALCQNRCRVRRTLCHSVRDWDTVQADAEHIDKLLQDHLDEQSIMPASSDAPSAARADQEAYALPLSSWAYLNKLRLMEWIVQVGFELDMYASDELGPMYWYLAYLAQIRAQHVERIKTFTTRAFNARRGPGKQAAYTKPVEQAFLRSLNYLRATKLDAAVTKALADGLNCLFVALWKMGGFGTGAGRLQYPYSSPALRYEVRMKPFMPVGLPELPTHDEFEASAVRGSGRSAATLLRDADKYTNEARKLFERIVNMSESEAFCMGGGDGLRARWLRDKECALKATIAAAALCQKLGRWHGEEGEEREKDDLEGEDDEAREKTSEVTAELQVWRTGTGLDAPTDGSEKERKMRLRVQIPKPSERYHEWWVVPKVQVTQKRDEDVGEGVQGPGENKTGTGEA